MEMNRVRFLVWNFKFESLEFSWDLLFDAWNFRLTMILMSPNVYWSFELKSILRYLFQSSFAQVAVPMIVVANSLLPVVLQKIDASFHRHGRARNIEADCCRGCKYFWGDSIRRGISDSIDIRFSSSSLILLRFSQGLNR